ncbi:hypothetical protein SGLAM104S_08026 [Streptomyces glaucescens]
MSWRRTSHEHFSTERIRTRHDQHLDHRAETSGDATAIREILLTAFPTALEADLVDALRTDPAAWIDGLSVVAADESGRPTGYALLTRCHIGEVPALCLGPVRRTARAAARRSQLAAVRAALAAATEAGERYVVVLGHPAYCPGSASPVPPPTASS